MGGNELVVAILIHLLEELGGVVELDGNEITSRLKNGGKAIKIDMQSKQGMFVLEVVDEDSIGE